MGGEVNDIPIGGKGFALLFRGFFSDVNTRLWVRRLYLLRFQLRILQVLLGVAEIGITESEHFFSTGFAFLFDELEKAGARKIVDGVLLDKIPAVQTNQSMERQIVKHVVGDDDQLLSARIRKDRLDELLIEKGGRFIEFL